MKKAKKERADENFKEAFFKGQVLSTTFINEPKPRKWWQLKQKWRHKLILCYVCVDTNKLGHFIFYEKNVKCFDEFYTLVRGDLIALSYEKDEKGNLRNIEKVHISTYSPRQPREIAEFLKSAYQRKEEMDADKAKKKAE
jgi:hypothetical protein